MGNKKSQRKQKTKRRKTHRLYAFVVIFLALVIFILGILVLFHVQKIEVTGNEYCSDQEIVDMVKSDKYSVNTLYILGKYAMGYGEKLPCLESVKLSLKAPWSIRITVKEKPIIGYVQGQEDYAYFDKEGLVVYQSPVLIEGLPCIVGVELEEIQLYQPLKSEDTQIFEEILATSQEVTKYGLPTERIVCREDRIYLYMGQVCVSLGNSVSSEKIAQISPILEKLGEQGGTLHLENYSETNETITFDMGELPEEN